MTLFLIPRTRRQQAKQAEHGGYKRILPGSWISDLAALGKSIMLCDLCIRKWEPHKVGYRRNHIWPGQNFANGDCDGCKRITRIYLYLPEGKIPFMNQGESY